MWFFFECISAIAHKMDYKSACIIAGAVLGFVIQLIIVIFLDARLDRRKKK